MFYLIKNEEPYYRYAIKMDNVDLVELRTELINNEPAPTPVFTIYTLDEEPTIKLVCLGMSKQDADTHLLAMLEKPPEPVDMKITGIHTG